MLCHTGCLLLVLHCLLYITKGALPVPNSMNFRKTSKRPLTPPLFSENYVALFATKFFGVQRPQPIPLPKKRNEIFRIENDPPPSSEVFGKFIEYGRDSSPLCQ